METINDLFLPEELNVLMDDYRLAIEPSEDRTYSIAAVDLLDPDQCLAYIERLKDIYETDSQMATASMFAKRYSYLTIASGLYAMSLFNKGLDYSIENCHLESIRQGAAWLPKVRLAQWEAHTPERCRNEWRDRVIKNIFADNLAKAWRALAKTAKISPAILWENTAIYVYYLYENRLEQGATPKQIARIRDDYEYLLNEAPAHLFGESNNPLTRFNTPKRLTAASEEPVRLRKTCCFYYVVADDPEDYCHSCPKIKHQFV
ncbi:(2Fe-2S)-binding protein [Paenibacillus sp. PR3]|uniref:(2Fe-2S)-binding protein n=1 Tax=Paenibacillus terricola TaxID=2763503 RepID=A0ABR8N3N1_9BACL|nr:IucA/IucC family C-terminal-domain containing protein [Paenibacillus terricola]MBD3922465.1 (2Fe-2S)-binding protein [Paenibacillus terricola]